MPSFPATRTARRLLKVVSLGLAGLLAGLLTGCNTASDVSANAHATHTLSSSENDFSQLPPSLDARQIPALRHPPSARRLEYGSVSTGHPQLMPVGRKRS
jgi:hypothetical protein